CARWRGNYYGSNSHWYFDVW
nr:immunoglobulin heavy chain junction region [Mus musculus]